MFSAPLCTQLSPSLTPTLGILRGVDLWASNCVIPASSLPLAAGAFSRNSLPINIRSYIVLVGKFATFIDTPHPPGPPVADVIYGNPLR